MHFVGAARAALDQPSKKIFFFKLWKLIPLCFRWQYTASKPMCVCVCVCLRNNRASSVTTR